MKTVKVVAAVICDDLNKKNKVFATARGYGEYKGKWEFPGGKIEEGETPSQALKREIEEELDTEINVGDYICTVEYDYPSFHLSMDCFFCEVVKGQLVLKEAEEAKWLTKDTIDSVEWLPADAMVVEKIKGLMVILGGCASSQNNAAPEAAVKMTEITEATVTESAATEPAKPDETETEETVTESTTAESDWK